MHSGELTVSKNGETSILLLKRPKKVHARFESDHNPIPCNHHHDKLDYYIIHEDEDLRRHHGIVHQHQDRKFYLVIEWEVDGVRTIHWSVTY